MIVTFIKFRQGKFEKKDEYFPLDDNGKPLLQVSYIQDNQFIVFTDNFPAGEFQVIFAEDHNIAREYFKDANRFWKELANI
jgi:hypothetical protein